jgi:hypothetical protein
MTTAMRLVAGRSALKQQSAELCEELDVKQRVGGTVSLLSATHKKRKVQWHMVKQYWTRKNRHQHHKW